MRPRAAGVLLLVSLATAGTSAGATRAEVLDVAVRVCDRLAAKKPVGRNWEDVPYLYGTLLLAEELERDRPGAGRRLLALVEASVGNGDPVITNGDYAGYAQAALELYRLTPPAGAARRAALLAATDGPLAFDRRALRTTPDDGQPFAPWWVEGGYGVRFWQDDFLTQPPCLAMRGSARDGLPADPEARDLAYEWIEAYVYDHRPRSADPRVRAVPVARERAGFLLWDPGLELFRHDPNAAADGPFWGRGNGWVGYGLAIAARFLDEPYAGGRFDAVLDRAAIRALASRLAGSLTALRTADGGWGTNLLSPPGTSTAETSATGLIAFFIARGVNEGWLDREVFTPVVLKALSLLRTRIDAERNVTGIQPPGTGPDGAVTSSDDPSVNVNYGVGAVLLAAAEASRFPAEDLARLEDEAARPVDRDPLRRTWLVPVPSPLEPLELTLANRGAGDVRAVVEVRDALGLLLATAASLSVPAGGTAQFSAASSPCSAAVACVLTIRATNDLALTLSALDPGRSGAVETGDGRIDDSSLLEIGASALQETLASGEAADLRPGSTGLFVLGGANPGRLPATLVLTVSTSDGHEDEVLRLSVRPLGAAFVQRRLKAEAAVRFSAESPGGSVLPIVLRRSGGSRPKASHPEP